MESINISKHTKYSLEFILSESDKMACRLLDSISENVNKSFILFAILCSLLSFSFIKITDKEYLYIILLIGSIISGTIIHKNLFPNTIIFNGSEPNKMINIYFDSFKEEILDKEYLATQIENYNYAMNENHKTIKKMVNRFNCSIISIIISFIIFGISFVFSLIECSNA